MHYIIIYKFTHLMITLKLFILFDTYFCSDVDWKNSFDNKNINVIRLKRIYILSLRTKYIIVLKNEKI